MQWRARQLWDTLPTNLNTNARADTFDVLHYQLELDLTQHREKRLEGICAIQFQTLKTGVDQMTLDLEGLTVDSAFYKGKPLLFFQDDPFLTLLFAKPLPKDSPSVVTIYYQGRPQSDASWGGFYYRGDYAYNLGVGFAANPHNYGRVWHPCMDNFRERATYQFKVITTAPQRAHCNGRLLSELKLGSRITRIWKQPEPIPTYLAALAVAPYTVVKYDHIGVADTIPIRLAAEVEDTADLKASFVHLPKAIDAYEHWYGPHRWTKVGYSLVPFRAGAMEHASNIAYPRFAANGTLSRERLMAHELGHSWWGNLVTCDKAEDMWINEGMATYSEHLFVEWVYGKAAYRKAVQDNHYLVLRQAHQREGGYRPITGVPYAYTYGIHVYKKGASVAHNLRWYLGDAAFRKGLQHVTKRFAYQNIHSARLRDVLSQHTGVDLRPFFDDWVFQGGFPHFACIDWTATPTPEGANLKLVVQQQLVGRKNYFQKVPLPLTVWSAQGERYATTIQVSDSVTEVEVPLPFLPQTLLLNEAHQLNQARYDEAFVLDTAQIGRLSLNRNVLQWEDLMLRNLTDTARLHLHRHPVPVHTPTEHRSTAYALDQKGYWSISGDLPTSWEAEATLRPRGRYEDGADGVTVLLYRAHPAQPWRPHPNYVRGKWLGAEVLVFSVLKGEYVLAKGTPPPHSEESKQRQVPQVLRQQAVKDHWEVDWAFDPGLKVELLLYDDEHNLLYRSSQRKAAGTAHIACPLDPNKTYFLKWINAQGKVVHAQPVMKQP